MPDFLVQVDVQVPGRERDQEISELREAELRYGRELKSMGIIKHIWRVPGRQASVAIWSARDASELHAHIALLPLFPYLDIRVSALATHPLQEP